MRASAETRPTVQAVVEGLGYNFDHFNIEDFQHHVAGRRGRPLEVRYVPLSPELFGFWFPAEHADYVAINAKLHPAHRIHTLLHELAHMLLGHRGRKLGALLDDEIAHELNIPSGEGHLRSAVTIAEPDNFQEREAELFVMIVRRKLVSSATPARALQRVNLNCDNATLCARHGLQWLVHELPDARIYLKPAPLALSCLSFYSRPPQSQAARPSVIVRMGYLFPLLSCGCP